MPNKITHKVLDLHYTEEEGQECYTGSLEECEFWVSFQSPEFMYQIVPLPKQQVEVYNKEN